MRIEDQTNFGVLAKIWSSINFKIKLKVNFLEFSHDEEPRSESLVRRAFVSHDRQIDGFILKKFKEYEF